MRRDTGNRDQRIVPGPQILILPDGVLDRLIKGDDFRLQPGDHRGHGGVGRRAPLARVAPVGPLHPGGRQRFAGAHQITQLAQGG